MTATIAEWPTVSDRPEVQAFYEVLREQGQSHNMAELLAFRQPPGTNWTDRAFWAGKCNGNQFEGDEVMGNYLRRVYRLKTGRDVPPGAWYSSRLASETGDPQAWITDTSDIRRVVTERNYNSEGLFSHRAVEHPIRETPKDYVAEDIVLEEVAKRAAGQTITKKEFRELKNKVRSDMAPKA